MRNDTNEIGTTDLDTVDLATIELSDLQLGLVSGGTGEVVIA